MIATICPLPNLVCLRPRRFEARETNEQRVNSKSRPITSVKLRSDLLRLRTQISSSIVVLQKSPLFSRALSLSLSHSKPPIVEFDLF